MEMHKCIQSNQRDTNNETPVQGGEDSSKVQIIFHKRAIKYRSLLRKTTFKDKGSYESSPPCIQRKSARHTATHCNTLQQQTPTAPKQNQLHASRTNSSTHVHMHMCIRHELTSSYTNVMLTRHKTNIKQVPRVARELQCIQTYV